ncbi:MAG: tRNA (guanosine(46)-N7)-methyltransferase TrmB [Bacteroidota bacterium]
MGRKDKLRRFAEVAAFDNVVEPTTEQAMSGQHPLKGRWNQDHFGRDQPIVLELGCGKGEYTVGLAERYPERNFIGVDIKGARIWRGAKTATETGMPNVAFLRTRIEFITSFFEPGEVDEVWITFPDPQPQQNRRRKRLTHPLFMERYQQFVKPGGLLHLKTDNEPLYDFTLEVAQELNLEVIEATNNLYGPELDTLQTSTREILSIKTHYEGIFSAQGFSICYLTLKL